MRFETLVGELFRSRGIAATHRLGCQSIEHVGGCKLVPERPELLEALLVELGPALEIAGDVGRPAERAERSCSPWCGCVRSSGEQQLEPAPPFVRVLDDPELFERDGESQPEQSVSTLESLIDGAAEVVLLGNGEVVPLAEVDRLSRQVGRLGELEEELCMPASYVVLIARLA